MKKLIVVVFALILALSVLVGCSAKGGGGTPTDGDPDFPGETAQVSEPTATPIPRAPMNDPQTIIDGMEAMLEPAYAYYGGAGANHLALPPGFTPDPGGVLSIEGRGNWDLGDLLIRFGDTGQVAETGADVRDFNTVNTIAAALFASSVQGVTPEVGQRIADVLHVGDFDFTPSDRDKYDYVIDYEGYYYICQIGNFFRLAVVPNDYEIAFAQFVFFDINGNEITNPAAGADGFDAQGNLSQTTGDAAKDALVQSLLPPGSTITQARSDTVHIESLTDYPSSLKWYTENLPKLGFVSTMPPDQQALWDMDEQSRIYSGTINGQPLTIMVRDWSGTYNSGDMSLIEIMFSAFGT